MKYIAIYCKNPLQNYCIALLSSSYKLFYTLILLVCYSGSVLQDTLFQRMLNLVSILLFFSSFHCSIAWWIKGLLSGCCWYVMGETPPKTLLFKYINISSCVKSIELLFFFLRITCFWRLAYPFIWMLSICVSEFIDTWCQVIKKDKHLYILISSSNLDVILILVWLLQLHGNSRTTTGKLSIYICHLI